MKIIAESERLIDDYMRHGPKGGHRREQRERMREFILLCARMRAFSLAQVGDRHCIAYWKANRGLSAVTLYAHWRAIRDLWKLAGKPSEPPKPFMVDKHDVPELQPSADHSSCDVLLRKWEGGALLVIPAAIVQAASMKAVTVVKLTATSGRIVLSVPDGSEKRACVPEA